MVICGFILIVWKLYLAIDRIVEQIKSNLFLCWFQVVLRGILTEVVSVVRPSCLFPTTSILIHHECCHLGLNFHVCMLALSLLHFSCVPS